jgi:hypothetical protein
MTDTTWLEAAGLVPVSGGVWRDPETGLEVEERPGMVCVAAVRVGRGDYLEHVEVHSTRVIYCDIPACAASPEWADAFADALHLAARIARAYNERSQ